MSGEGVEDSTQRSCTPTLPPHRCTPRGGCSIVAAAQLVERASGRGARMETPPLVAAAGEAVESPAAACSRG